MDDLQQLLLQQAGGQAQQDPLQTLLVQQAQGQGQGQTKQASPQNGVNTSFVGRVLKGMKDPIDGGAQLLTHILPQSLVDAGNKANNWLADKTGLVTKLPEGGLDQSLQQDEQKYQSARQASAPKTLSSLVTGQNDPGFDAARLVGNIFSPANLALALRAPTTVATLGGLARQGAVMGGVGGALTPDTTGGDGYLGNKALQVSGGTIGGALLTPVVGKIVSAVAPKIAALFADKEITGARASLMTDQAIKDTLQSMQLNVENLPNGTMDNIRSQVLSALKTGKQLDPAALMRENDFSMLGIPATQGQITRDATQFASERNLRAVPGAGEPLLNRFAQQNTGLSKAVADFGGPSAMERYPAGTKIMSALNNADQSMKSNIDSLYSTARDSSGRYANLDVSHFSSASNNALDEGMLGSVLPAQAKNLLNDVSTGKIPLNVNTAVQLDRVFGGMQRGASVNDAEKLSLGVVRNALNTTPIDSTAGAEAKTAFDTARSAAKARFDLHDAIPALKASADKFVSQFIINGDTKSVQDMAKMLPSDAFQEARNQIGAQLQKAAFGENSAGDKVFSPERYAQALRNIGNDKLKAFYNQPEIDKIHAVGRVGAYINSTPAASPVMGNPNMFWAGKMADLIPGGSKVTGAVQQLSAALSRAKTVNSAVNPTVDTKPYLTPEYRATLARLLSGSGVGGGMIVAPRGDN